VNLPPAVAAQFAPSLTTALSALRRDLHRHPELAFQETVTAVRLLAALTELGIDDVRRVGVSGLVARIPGRDRRAQPVAVRGDIDALPIHEATGLPFASEVAGVMHACGHDVHATWALGAAALLREHPAEADTLVVFQPAEEIGTGALSILESGALDGVRAIFGGHVDRRFDVGTVVADVGPLAASADTFDIELIGSGAHAARPHEARDPVVALGAVISALQTIVARRLNPATPGVVTIGTVSAGTAANVIPDRARLGGTVRAVDASSRAMMLGELRRVTETIAAGLGVRAQVTFDRGTPPVVNPAEATSWARRAAASLLGEQNVVPLGFLNLAGEDFAHYLEHMPGCFLRVGAREPGSETIPAHSPSFYAAEESVFVGAAILAECARVAARE
jgi:hippurate hydrolase